MAAVGRSIPNFKLCFFSCFVLCVFGASVVLLQFENYSSPRKWRASAAGALRTGALEHLGRTSWTQNILDSFRVDGRKKSENNNGSSFDEEAIDLLFIFTRANEIRHLERKLVLCLRSVVRHTSSKLNLHVITDAASLAIATKALHTVLEQTSRHISFVQVYLYDVARIIEPLQETVIFLQPHFSYKPGTYYSNALFFLSVALHRVLPMDRIVAVDIDTKFAGDVRILDSHFRNFSSGAVIGLANEQQPVYLHLLHEYRQKFPGSSLGAPPPKGNPGFNSGVMLLDLRRMRESTLYNGLINATAVDELTRKYLFKGHLGDQDFFTLLSFDYPQLFYTLPCNWNRQLCLWWKHHGYKDVFDSYYKCLGPYFVYHGNCNTPIP